MSRDEKTLVGKIAVGVVALLALFIVANSIFIVEEYEYGIVYRMNKIIRVEEDAGLKTKIPFIDKVVKEDNRYMIHDLPPSDVFTQDKKNMEVDTLIIWRISDPLQMARTLRSQTEAENRIEANVYSDIQTISGKYTQEEILLNRQNNGLDTLVTEEAQKSINTEKYGIEIVDVQIEKFDFPSENKEAILDRMISERHQIVGTVQAEGAEEAKRILNKMNREEHLIRSEAQSESAKIKAEGDREYMRIMNTAYDTPEKQDLYEIIVAYDTLKTALRDNQTVIVGKDSDIAKKLLKQ